MKGLTLALVAILGFTATVRAEDDPLAVDGGWVLRIETRGGFTGQGRGTFTVTSSGEVTCSAATCPSKLPQLSTRRIADTIATLMPVDWRSLDTAGTCSDCYQIFVTLRMREQGEMHVYQAQWYDGQPAPPQAAALVEAVIGIVRQP